MINELTTAQIESLVELYIGYFTRAPEASGLNYWKGEYIARLNAGQGDNQALTEIADLFYSAALQFSDQTGYSADDTPAEFIQKIYANVLLRSGTLAPPAEDIAYWEAELSSGRVSLGGLVKRMISDAKAFDGDPQWGFVADTLANRKAVAAAWATSEEGQAIGGAEAVLRGKAILSTIDSTDASREQALGVIADLDSGDTTVFSGPGLDRFADGTLRIDDNVFERNSSLTTPNTILVANGADLVVDGVVVLAGQGVEVTVRGEGSSLLVKADFDQANSSYFPSDAGSTAVVNIANGADVTFEGGFNLAAFEVAERDDGSIRGVVGGDSIGTLNVLGGSTLTLNDNANFAAQFSDNNFAGDGSETGTANVLISGPGSRIDINNNYAEFGVSQNGTANVSILGGGVLAIDGGAGFGKDSSATRNFGGDAHVLVQGDGSQLTVAEDAQFGEFATSTVSLTVDDGGLFRAAGLQFARAGATGQLTVSDKGRLEITQYNSIGDFAGSKVDVLVTRGGVITSTDNFNFANFDAGTIFDDGRVFRGIANGHTDVDIVVSAGGQIIGERAINLAFRYDPTEVAQGNETASGKLTITGAGSLVESKSGGGGFGITAGAVANLEILEGGTLLLGEGANFGGVADQNPAKGGSAVVKVDGIGSSIKVYADTFLDRGRFEFGRGENANATLNISNGGKVESRGAYFGVEGGQATATIDAADLNIYGKDENGFARWLEIGRHASSQGGSSVTVQNGGKITIDGQGSRSPGIGIAEDAGGKGSLIVTGTGSSVTVLNDLPRGVNGATEFGNALVKVGQDGNGDLRILNGATFSNTANGILEIGHNQGGEGLVLVVGGVLNYGAALILGGGSNGGGTAELTIQSGATLNQTGIVKGQPGENDFGGVNVNSDDATLVLDSTATFNSDLFLQNGRFIVSGADEAAVINGRFDQDGGVIEMALGLAVHDRLDVTGLLDLDGTLNIKLIGSLAPADGATFELFTANDIEIGNNFDLVVDGLAAGMDAQVQITGGVAVLAFSETPVSDFIFL